MTTQDSSGKPQRELDQSRLPLDSLEAIDTHSSVDSSKLSQQSDTVDIGFPVEPVDGIEAVDPSANPDDLTEFDLRTCEAVQDGATDVLLSRPLFERAEDELSDTTHDSEAEAQQYAPQQRTSLDDLLPLMRSQNGEVRANAWMRIWNLNKEAVYWRISRILDRFASPEEADDLTSQAFELAIRYFGACRSTTYSKFTHWLLTIASNLALRRREQLAALWARTDDDVSEFLSGTPDQIANDQSPGYSPGEPPQLTTFDFAEQSALSMDIQDAFAQLSPRQQICLIRANQGYKYREIADELGISLGNVARTISDAYNRLAQILRARGGY